MQQNQEKQFTFEQIFAPNQLFPQRKFTLFRLAGKGTQGQVYLAQSKNWKYDNNKNFALKFSYKDQVSNNELNFLKYIMEYQESEFEQKVPCDMIKVLDIFDFKHNNQDYIVTVMEQGDSDLYQYLKINRTQLTELQKIKICLDITNPIYFLHQKQMLHRDIKPENYIQVEGKFKLIDFGLIKQSNRVQTIGVGTPIFQAPEIVDNSKNYTEKVDVWALACVYYEVFIEVPLFQCFDQYRVKEKILSHKRDQNEVFQKINKMNCSQQFKQLMQNMLQPLIKNRFDSSQVINRLKEIYNQMIKSQNLQIEEPQISILKIPYPPIIKQLNNNVFNNINKSQSQVYSFEEQLIKQIKISEEKTETNSKQLEIKLIKMLEEKEQKQVEILKQIQQEKNEQNYQQQILTLNQKNDQIIENHKQEINRLENQFNQDKTQQNQQITNLVNQVNFLVQNQNEYLKKQKYQKLIENLKQENLQQQKALQQNLKGLQTQITTINTSFCNQLNYLKAEQSSNETFQQIPNTFNKEQVNLIIQISLQESINKFQEQFNTELQKQLEIMREEVNQFNENQLAKYNLLSINEELDQKFSQFEQKFQQFINKTENTYNEQQNLTQNLQGQIESYQQKNQTMMDNQFQLENQIKLNVDLIQSKYLTDINDLRNTIQQEISLQFDQSKISLEDQLQQEFSKYFSTLQHLEKQYDQLSKEKILFQFQDQLQENYKDQYLNQKIDELKETQLAFVINQQNFYQQQLQQCKIQIEKLNQRIEQQLPDGQQEISIIKEDHKQTIKDQFTKELKLVKDEFQLEIQNLRKNLIESSQKQQALLQDELKNIKLNMNQSENYQNQFQKQIDELKQQFKQQINNIQCVKQEIHKYNQEFCMKQQSNQQQNQQQKEQLEKIEQNLNQQSLFQEQLRQQQDYKLLQIYNYINQSQQTIYYQQQQQIQYLNNQMNENKENCEEKCDKLKKNIQNNIKNQQSLIEEIQEKLSIQLNEFQDFKKKERQIFKIIVEIFQVIPNFQIEQIDKLKEQILGLLGQRQSNINQKVEKISQQEKVNELQFKIGSTQFNYQQSKHQDNNETQSLINFSGQMQSETRVYERTDSQNEKQMIHQRFELDFNQKQNQSIQRNLSDINQNPKQLFVDKAFLIDATQQKLDSLQKKEQEINSNHLNQEQLQYIENLTQPENIQNILNNSQGFQQYQNIVENQISEHDLGNIY